MSLPSELQEESKESIIRHYWRIFFRRRWVILTAVLGCLAVALIVSMLTQREYTATTRVQIAREAAKVVDMQGVDDDERGGVDLEFYQTQYALLKSRSLSEAVVRSLGLADNYEFLARYDRGDVDEMKAMPQAERFARATDIVNDSTIISPVRLSSIVDISAQESDPIMAATLANAIAEKFIETNLSRRFEATAYARQFLQNRLNSVRQKLEESERKATEYARREGLIKIVSSTPSGEVSNEQSLVSADLAQLSSQLALARAAREKAEADYQANSGGNAAASSLSNVAVNQLRGQRAELAGELRKLQSDFGPDYPKVAAISAQIRELDKQIAKEERMVTSSVAHDLRDRYRQALATEQGLQARVDALKGNLLDQQQRSIQFNIIQRDVDTNRALYDALLQRFKEVGVAGGVGTNNVSIVDRALTPERPSSPNLPLNLALGLLIGLALGAGAAIILEQLAEAVILPADFQRKLGLPLLGAVPAGKQEENGWFAPKSDVSEAYFSVLTALQFSTSEGTPSTLAVTSSQPSEGKSTTAVALARGLASVGSRVLLIDADMRNPSLHKVLKVSNAKGLSDLLTGRTELKHSIQPTAIDGVHVIPSGPIPPNPAELLSGNTLKAILKSSAGQFDHVLLDAPPVLGLADALLVSMATEGTVFVVESGRTRSSQARQALGRLTSIRAHLLGAVLTKLNVRNSGYGYGYGYNYQYGTA
jgi:capsular exopolysaccharide synthesis family protein